MINPWLRYFPGLGFDWNARVQPRLGGVRHGCLGGFYVLFVLLTCTLQGCVLGPLGTLAARRTLTSTAEIMDVYALGFQLRTDGLNPGLTLGWYHTTHIYPREASTDEDFTSRWHFGWVPARREAPFFLATRSVGAAIGRTAHLTYLRAGYQEDNFTFASEMTDSHIVSFHYKPAMPSETRLTMIAIDAPLNR